MYKVNLISRSNLSYFEINGDKESFCMDEDIAKAFELDTQSYQNRLVNLLKRNKIQAKTSFCDITFTVDSCFHKELIDRFKDEFIIELVMLGLGG